MSSGIDDGLEDLNKPALPVPAEMVGYLDRFIRGQVRAKRDVAVAVYNHYISQAHLASRGADLGRHHILLLGPTGTGKTYIVKKLAEFLNVPVGFTSATSLVETGYAGDPVDNVIRALLDRADNDPRQAERGIVFIDEIDKIRRQDVRGLRDISGEGVQNGLLTLMDGRIAKGRDAQSFSPVDTSKLLFICTGAFVDLEEIIRRRIGTHKGAIGFRPIEHERVEEIPNANSYEALCQVETQDLVRYGMIPEFIGRFATLTVLHDLSRDDLKVILTSTEGSAIEKQKTMAELHGINLVFDAASLDAIASEAAAMATGARGLHRLVNRSVDGVDFRWSSLADEGVNVVRITADCVLRGADPIIEKGGQKFTRMDQELRRVAIVGLPRAIRPVAPNTGATLPPGITDATGMSSEAIWDKYSRIKHDHLDWDATVGSARKWWLSFENENAHRPALVLRLAEELQIRKATITEFFLCYVYSNTDNIQANLHYMDYSRLKKDEERRTRENRAPSPDLSPIAKDDETDPDAYDDEEEALKNLLADMEEQSRKIEEENQPKRSRKNFKPSKKSPGELDDLLYGRCKKCRSLIAKSSKKCRVCGAKVA